MRGLFRLVGQLQFVLLLPWLVAPAAAASPRPPNVILILVDDLGWADLGCYGSSFHQTPNLDALARSGALFTDAYAASPVCSPTRASILSGKYPSRIGMSYLAGVRGPSGPGHRLLPPPVAGSIPQGDITLAEALREAGYATAHIGKWHLQGHTEKGEADFPERHGFDVNIGGHRAGQPGSYYFPYKSKNHPATDVPGLNDGREGDYLTDALTDQAIGFMRQHAEEPFFLNLWYYTVHTPIEPRRDQLAVYKEKARRLGLDKGGKQAAPELQSFTRTRQSDPAYAAMVAVLDENVGRLMAELQRLGLSEDTIVVFFSDNGGLSTGPGPNMPACNLPLRAGKAWLYEGGIREPFIVSYPAAVKAGLRISEPVVSTDIYPTILGLAGLPPRPQQHVDGLDLAQLLEGKADSLDREAIYFHLPHYHHINTMGPSGAVRAGDHKLVEVYETGKTELYNLRDDPGEQHDLSAEKPELARELAARLRVWRKSSGSKEAVPNPDYDAGEDWRRKPGA